MANDTELIGSFIWGKPQKNLSKFLKQYQLPQIVRVVDGFCGKNEETSINNEQILAFHEICSVQKLLGTDSSGKQVIIPLTCPTQVLVCPSKCKYTPCKVEDFKSIFPKLQYVRVKSCGPQSRNASDILQRSLKVGDILQIQKIDKKKKSVVCQNTDTKGEVTLSYTSPAIFTPLLDSRKYTLSEVVINYGLHSRVCFETTRSQAEQNLDQWNSSLTGLTEVVFHKVLTEVKVIATTVGGGLGELTHCIGLPTDLPIRCAVAERFTKNGRSYEDFVCTLHAGFDSKNLSERVNVFQDINAVKIYDLTSSESMATVRQNQRDTLPSLVRSNAARNPPKVSPKPKKRIRESPNDSKYSLCDPKQPSQSPDDCTMTAKVHDEPARNSPEVGTTAAEVYGKLSQSRPEDRATTDEEGYVDTSFFEKHIYEYVDCEKDKHSVDNQNNLGMYFSRKYSHLTGNATDVNAPSTPKVQDHLRNKGLQQQAPFNQPEINSKHSQGYEEVKPVQAPFNQPEINSKHSQGYEEVKPVWNSNSKQEFADPNLIHNDKNKEQLSENHSDYVIPMISPNVRPQTRKFVKHKRTDAKNKPSNTGYENVEFAREKQNGQRKHAYENVVTNVGMGFKFQE
ncbi:Hypothetical predicted protein [Paramuricea clavata]|uniref:Uncharacterized protein n=1 Tax=Paramuricea clavata TaxID=317549 RepID=A0A6S7FZW9_PARCT|nr:Hypothetical predicted protein [Paramuricea clavata]